MGRKNENGRVFVNRMYKDTIFRKLFQERKNLLSLYNAINGTSYQDPEELEIVTMDNAIYMSMKNDLAFILDCQMNLYEHQSTINPNMPLRFLNYVAAEYRKLLRGISLHTETLIRIPNPVFIVLYNGTDDVPERMVMNLSDAYEHPTENPNLELIVTQLNLNSGFNEGIKEACQILKEYMQYVEHVRMFAERMPLDEAVEHAVDCCIGKGILEDFLRKNRAEAIELSMFEYGLEQEFQMIRNQMKKDTRAKALKEGLAEGLKLAKRVIYMSLSGKTVSEIAAAMELSEDMVIEILNEE